MTDDKDINVTDPTSEAKDEQYDRSDVKHVLNKREWHSWQELVRWLRDEGDQDNELTPGEVRHLVEDFDRLDQRGVRYSTDVDQVYRHLTTT